MALISCPECGRMVSPNAEECPGCGAPIWELIAQDSFEKEVSDAETIENTASQNVDTNEHGSLLKEEPPKENSLKRKAVSQKNHWKPWIIAVAFMSIIAVLIFVFFLKKENVQPMTQQIDNTTTVKNESQSVPETTLHLNLYGRICSDNGSSMTIKGDVGEYHFIDYTRTLKVHQYNAATGELIVYGYEKNTDKYIGKFEGILNATSYQGKFTNYKGVECTFQFDRDLANKMSSETVSGRNNSDASDFEFNAIVTDRDGKYTNIRDINRNIIDKIPTNVVFRLYLDYYDGEGEWWHIRDSKVYDVSNNRELLLKGNDCWIHTCCISFI